MVADDVMLEIISLCLSMDARAVKIYTELEQCSANEDFREFWRSMAEEERLHVAFWRRLLESARKGLVPPVFDRPFEIKQDLVNITGKLDQLMSQSRECSEPGHAFTLAFRTEYLLLQPVVAELFRLGGLTGDDANLEEAYEGHLSRFIKGLNQFGAATPEMELLGEAIEQLWRENRKLVTQSHTDGLTGILNRRGLFHAIVPLSNTAQRNGSHVGVLMLDLDYFKRINDSHGHLVGDAVIRRIAHTIRDSIRKADLVGRFGGEEFLVYLSEIDPDHLGNVAEHIRSRCEKQRVEAPSADSVVPISVSIGGAHGILRGDAQQAVEILIKKADDALYEAKRNGRNRVVISSR